MAQTGKVKPNPRADISTPVGFIIGGVSFGLFSWWWTTGLNSIGSLFMSFFAYVFLYPISFALIVMGLILMGKRLVQRTGKK